MKMSIDVPKNCLLGLNALAFQCAFLRPEEDALVIVDPVTRPLGEALVDVIRRNSSACCCLEEIPAVEMHGQEPPHYISQRMASSHVVFCMTRKSMAHTNARLEAAKNGTRFLSLPDYSWELLASPALLISFRDIVTIANAVAGIFSRGKRAVIKSKVGTNLELDLGTRQGNSAPGCCLRPGDLASPPDAEANIAPLEHGSHGIVVVDGSIPCDEVGLLSEAVTLDIRAGFIDRIRGRQAETVARVLDRLSDPKTRILAELGVGLNHKALLSGNMLEDEGCMGTAHLGFGSNVTIGGLNKVPFHLDMVVRNVDLVVDDTSILANGKLVLENLS